MCWILAEEGKEEYQYYHKIKIENKKNKNRENYSHRNYYYENIDEWESLTW